MYLKRSNVPKKWPLPRKGSKYLVRPSQDREGGLPLLIVLRDIMELAQNRKEVKKLLNLGKIKVNNNEIDSVNYTIKLFDVLDLDGKKFKLVLEDKKFSIKEVKGKESGQKVAKVIGKKILKGGKKQVNLSDGRNYETDKKTKVGDSVLVDLKKSEIKKVLALEKGQKVLFISGKNMGKKGEVKDVGDKIMVKLDSEETETNKESIVVIE